MKHFILGFFLLFSFFSYANGDLVLKVNVPKENQFSRKLLNKKKFRDLHRALKELNKERKGKDLEPVRPFKKWYSIPLVTIPAKNVETAEAREIYFSALNKVLTSQAPFKIEESFSNGEFKFLDGLSGTSYVSYAFLSGGLVALREKLVKALTEEGLSYENSFDETFIPHFSILSFDHQLVISEERRAILLEYLPEISSLDLKPFVVESFILDQWGAEGKVFDEKIRLRAQLKSEETQGSKED